MRSACTAPHPPHRGPEITPTPTPGPWATRYSSGAGRGSKCKVILSSPSLGQHPPRSPPGSHLAPWGPAETTLGLGRGLSPGLSTTARRQKAEIEVGSPISPCAHLTFTESKHWSKDVERRCSAQGEEVAKLGAGPPLHVKHPPSSRLQLLELLLSFGNFLRSDLSLSYCNSTYQPLGPQWK